jgi:ketosteroid isomerase-like protein
MAEGMRYRLSASEDWRIAAAEFRDLDEERVLVLGHATARGKLSGLEVRQMNAAVFHIRADKVTRLITYTDHVGALADLGLED